MREGDLERYGKQMRPADRVPEAVRGAVRDTLLAETALPSRAMVWQIPALAATLLVGFVALSSFLAVGRTPAGAGPGRGARPYRMAEVPAFIAGFHPACVTKGPFLTSDLGGGVASLLVSASRVAQAQPYVVHEWGVIPLDPGGAVHVALGLSADLPGFVRESSAGAPRELPQPPAGMVLCAKPLLYFYGTDGLSLPLSLHCSVSFGRGEPMFVWPPAVLTIPKEGARPDGVRWADVSVGAAPAEGTAAPREVADGNWFRVAREVEALMVSVGGESEKFLFYDGAIPYVSPLRQDLEEDALALENTGPEAVHALWVIERRGGVLRIARRGGLAPGDRWTLGMETLERMEVAPAADRLAEDLRTAGLFDKEARGMADIWREDFFARDGQWILWRLDPPTVDRILPLELVPPPVPSPVRVHLAFAPLVPSLAGRIRPLVEALGDPSFAAREEATRRLVALGPIAAPHLKGYAEHADPEIAARVGAILERWKD